MIEAKGTLGKLLMQKDFYTRLENALVKIESTLKNSEAITRDVKSASGKAARLGGKSKPGDGPGEMHPGRS